VRERTREDDCADEDEDEDEGHEEASDAAEAKLCAKDTKELVETEEGGVNEDDDERYEETATT
jgi:hypothetical protein